MQVKKFTRKQLITAIAGLFILAATVVVIGGLLQSDAAPEDCSIRYSPDKQIAPQISEKFGRGCPDVKVEFYK